MNAPAEAIEAPPPPVQYRRWEPKIVKRTLPTILEDQRPLPRWVLYVTAGAIALAYALLWSPYWYPLADSGLYLSLGRSLADGDGFRYMGLPYKRITPLTPWIIALTFKSGGGIGAVHGVMIALLLVSNLFCFLTLRNWFNERTALLGTIVAAAQFWVWRNAIFIMTEPAFLAGFWTGMYCLSLIPKLDRLRWQWGAAVAACACLALAYESRAIPTLILIAFALAALWLVARRSIPWEHRTAWVVMFAVVFGFLLYEFGKPAEGAEDVVDDVVVDTARGEIKGSRLKLSDRYNVKAFANVKGPWWQKALYAPVLAGRWLNEGFVSPMVFFFTARSRVIFAAGCAFALLTLVFCVVGWLTVLARGYWWAALLPLYAGPFFVNWFGRVLPRYYVPIAPILFILLCVGATVSIAWAVRRWNYAKEAGYLRWTVVRVPAVFALLIVVGNVPVYAIEYYIRHSSKRDFYEYARQGALAELIDIGGYLQNHSDPTAKVWVNTGGFSQRVGFFLSGRRIEMPPDTRKGQVMVKKGEDAPQIHNFLTKVPLDAKHAIIFVTQHEWPDWHWPLKGPRKRTWWQLYERDYDTGEFRRVQLPRERDYLVKAVPASGLKGNSPQKQPEDDGIIVTETAGTSSGAPEQQER